MKKYFYLAAVSAMMLTACSSDKDVLQPTPEPSTPTVAAQQQAVAFDTYLAGTTASTRAGSPEGVMTTDKLKTTGKGFGVFAMFQDHSVYTTSLKPDFMYNEHVSWSGGWNYSPLKYWPNETAKNAAGDADSQSTPATAGANELDKLSFFAYAPYVATGTSKTLGTKGASDKITNSWHGSETYGIMAIQDEATAGDPLVEWKYTNNPDKNVDLLWGVAPAGMTYNAVNGTTINKPVGYPLLDMVKPDKDQKMKFLFQHALSRIGLSVVSAIDQIAAGDDGGKYDSDATRVLIESVVIYGDFGIHGVLNLNNPTTADANKANWANVTKSASTVDDPLFTIDVTDGYLAPDLRYVPAQINAVTGTTTPPVAGDPSKFAALNAGVLPSEQVLMAGGPDPSKVATDLTYAYGKALYKLSGSDYVRATTTAPTDVNIFSLDDGGNYTQVKKSGEGTLSMNGTKQYWKVATSSVTSGDGTTTLPAGTYYTVTGTLGENDSKYNEMTSDGTFVTEDGVDYYTLTFDEVLGVDYTGTCYTSLQPRYFMVIPSADATPTNIGVKIVYRVVTKDTKLSGNVSNVQNAITKETSIQLKSGKSYNLKLILGLTSVKLDATVADWLVADDTEIWLPKNNE